MQIVEIVGCPGTNCRRQPSRFTACSYVLGRGVDKNSSHLQNLGGDEKLFHNSLPGERGSGREKAS